jgi:hypothetical protein
MGFFDIFSSKRQAELQPVPQSAARNIGERRFAIDPSRMFDLEQTRQLDALFRISPAERDTAWVEHFYSAAWYASIAVGEPDHFDGPDGLPYYRFDLPRANMPFEAQSLGNLARDCVERNAGAAFFASADDPDDAPQFVLSMGLLDSLLRYDSADSDPIDRGEAGIGQNPAVFDVEVTGIRQKVLTTKLGHMVLLGSPSPDFLPPYTARALHRYMSRIWRIDDPRVHMLVDHNMRPGRNLVIGRKASSFASEQEIAGELQRLFWFLPRYRAIILMPEDWRAEQMDRLSDLFEG